MSLTKTCRDCGYEKPIDDFYRWKSKGSSGFYKTCKGCWSEREVKRFQDSDRTHRDRNLRFKFGITEEEYQWMLEDQNYVCAICWEPERVVGRSLAVDHDHKTGKIRGLLCHSCNTGLGKFLDDPKLLVEASEYLLAHMDQKD